MTEYRDDQMTPEIPSHIKPVRSGVYRHPNEREFAFYSTEFQCWGPWADSFDDALEAWMWKGSSDAIQDKRWRGLNFNPDAKGGAA